MLAHPLHLQRQAHLDAIEQRMLIRSVFLLVFIEGLSCNVLVLLLYLLQCFMLKHKVTETVTWRRSFLHQDVLEDALAARV